MKGEKQMIYKNIIFKADPFSYDLKFDDRITLVGGDSGVGKTVLYEMLEDIRLTDEYKAIRLFNYRSDDFQNTIKQCRDSFIVVDNADNLINDEVRKFINFELSNQYTADRACGFFVLVLPHRLPVELSALSIRNNFHGKQITFHGQLPQFDL